MIFGPWGCVWVEKQAWHQAAIPRLLFYRVLFLPGDFNRHNNQLGNVGGTVLQQHKVPLEDVLSLRMGWPSGTGWGVSTGLWHTRDCVSFLLVPWLRSSWWMIHLSKVFSPLFPISVLWAGSTILEFLPCSMPLCLCLALPSGSAVLFSASVP